MAVSKSVRLGPSPGTSAKNKLTPGDGTGIRVCLRSRILWVRVPPGRLNGELPLIGKGAVLKTAVFRHLGVQVSHSPLNASVA